MTKESKQLLIDPKLTQKEVNAVFGESSIETETETSENESYEVKPEERHIQNIFEGIVEFKGASKKGMLNEFSLNDRREKWRNR